MIKRIETSNTKKNFKSFDTTLTLNTYNIRIFFSQTKHQYFIQNPHVYLHLNMPDQIIWDQTIATEKKIIHTKAEYCKFLFSINISGMFYGLLVLPVKCLLKMYNIYNQSPMCVGIKFVKQKHQHLSRTKIFFMVDQKANFNYSK